MTEAAGTPPRAEGDDACEEAGGKEIRKKIERLIATRPGDHISSYLVQLRDLDIGRKSPSTFYLNRDALKPVAESIVSQFGHTLADGLQYPSMAGGAYSVSSMSPVRYLMGCVQKDTEAIVELGTGWSCDLFQIYIGLGAHRARNIKFHGAAFTKEGQLCGSLLAEHEKTINYFAHGFNPKTPNVAYLDKYTKHILVFSRQALGQAETLNPYLYQQLWSLDARVTIVHFEPIGWQRRPDLLARRLANDEEFFKALEARVKENIASPERQIENAAWWSWRQRSNTNLLGIVNTYCRELRAHQVRAAYDYAATTNVLKPESLIHLEFIKPLERDIDF